MFKDLKEKADGIKTSFQQQGYFLQWWGEAFEQALNKT